MLHTLDVKTVNSSTMLLIIRSMLRMQHIKTVNSSTMLFINHTIDTSSSACQYIAIGETENSITITQKIKNPVLEREYVRFYV